MKLKHLLGLMAKEVEKGGEEVLERTARQEAEELIEKLGPEDREALLDVLKPSVEEKVDEEPERKVEESKKAEAVPARVDVDKGPEAGAGRPPAQRSKQAFRPDDLAEMSSKRINELWDKGAIHSMYGQDKHEAHNPV